MASVFSIDHPGVMRVVAIREMGSRPAVAGGLMNRL
jgi:hypothetical protein